jgi:hypothetical protein
MSRTSHRCARPQRAGRTGFTMVELAIAVALATMIVAGLYQLFIIQSRQLQFLDMQTEMNQNLRFGADVITRTVRNAGLGTANGVRGVLGNTGSGEILNPVLAHNDPLGTGSDAITIVHQDPSLTMNTSSLALYPGDTSQLSFDLTMHDYRAKFPSYASGEFLLCSDFANPVGMNSFMWEISGASASADEGVISVYSNASYADYDTLMPPERNLPPVMTCSKGEVVTFYIDNDDGDGIGPGSAAHPVLMMDLDYDWPEGDDVPLVDDIEDLQFAYCLEDTEGLHPCTSASEWYDNMALTEWPWMVRVNLLARSRREEASGRYVSQRPGLEDNAGSTTTDAYYRQVMTTEVTLRNMRVYSNLFDN